MKKLILIGLVAIFFANYVIADSVKDINDRSTSCEGDFSKLEENPLLTAQNWIKKTRHLNPIVAIASLWKGHPSNRMTTLEFINQKGIIISTSSLFNMSRQFLLNNKVAVDIILKNDNGCTNQIRAEGTILPYDKKTNKMWIHEKDNQKEKGKFVFFKIKPVWVQLSSSGGPKDVYHDLQYVYINGKWEKDNLRKVHLQ